MAVYAKTSVNVVVSQSSDLSNPFATTANWPTYTTNPASAQVWRIDVINGTQTINLSAYTSVTQVVIMHEVGNSASIQVNYTDATTNNANQVTLPINSVTVLPNVKVSANIALVSTAAGSAWVCVTGN